MELKIKINDFLPEGLGQNYGCTFYMKVHYTGQNMVITL